MIIIVGDEQYRYVKKPEAKKAPENLETDRKFLQDKHLSVSNQLYRLDYSFRKLSTESLAHIQANLVPFLMPPINSYVPRNLEMKSLCVEEEPLAPSLL